MYSSEKGIFILKFSLSEKIFKGPKSTFQSDDTDQLSQKTSILFCLSVLCRVKFKVSVNELDIFIPANGGVYIDELQPSSVHPFVHPV